MNLSIGTHFGGKVPSRKFREVTPANPVEFDVAKIDILQMNQ